MLKQGEILKKLRTERNLTQEELGKYIGVSGQSINNWENDRRKYDLKAILKLSDFFNVTTDYLLGLSEDKKPIEDITERQKKAIRMTDQLTDEQFKSILEMVLSFKKD